MIFDWFRSFRYWLIELLGGKLEDEHRVSKNEGPGPLPRKLPTLEMSSSEKPQYRVRRCLLTKSESIFYNALTRELGEEYFFFAKVRLGDLFFVANEPAKRSQHVRQLFTRHFDFILCDMHYQPVLAIELDDPTHKNFNTQESDKFKDSICVATGFRLLRIKASPPYSGSEIREWINLTLKSSATVSHVGKDAQFRPV